MLVLDPLSVNDLMKVHGVLIRTGFPVPLKRDAHISFFTIHFLTI